MEKLMTAKIETAVFALGLLKDQWESPETYYAMQAIEELGNGKGFHATHGIRIDAPGVPHRRAKEKKGLDVPVGTASSSSSSSLSDEENWVIELGSQGSTGHLATDDECIQRLVALMKSVMPNTTTSIGESLTGMLKEWTTIAVEKDGNGTPVFALSFTTNMTSRVIRAIIPRDFTKNNQRNRIKSTLEYLLSHNNFRQQTYIMGTTTTEMAFCWDTITPPEERTGVLKVSNPKWNVHDAIDDILNSAYDPGTGSGAKGKTARELKHISIDTDPDITSAAQRLDDVFATNRSSLSRLAWGEDPEDVFKLITDTDTFEGRIRSGGGRSSIKHMYPQDMIREKKREEKESKEEAKGEERGEDDEGVEGDGEGEGEEGKEGKEEKKEVKRKPPGMSLKQRLDVMTRLRHMRASDAPSPLTIRGNSFSTFTTLGSEGEEVEEEKGALEEVEWKEDEDNATRAAEVSSLVYQSHAMRMQREVERKREIEDKIKEKERKKEEAKEKKEKKKQEAKEKKKAIKRKEKEERKEQKKKRKKDKERFLDTEAQEGEEEPDPEPEQVQENLIIAGTTDARPISWASFSSTSKE
jgi:hypothetical protein